MSRSSKHPYDTYDYPSYWNERNYEHDSEVIAVTRFFNRIGHKETLLDVGGGFGRLLPYYQPFVSHLTLSDPSEALLKEAKERFSKHPVMKSHPLSYVHSSLDALPKNTTHRFDVVTMVRVLHHISSIHEAFQTLSQLVKPHGFLILEFANKMHGKATIGNLLHGNFTFPLDIFPTDRKSEENKNAPLPFLNFHPEVIFYELEEHGFQIVQKLSVSNVRSEFIKRNFPLPLLLSFEKLFQTPLAAISFGPSIFVLCQKVKK
jgi:SAM-dependent methyltransferase